MKYVLFYDSAEYVLEKAAAHFEAHAARGFVYASSLDPAASSTMTTSSTERRQSSTGVRKEINAGARCRHGRRSSWSAMSRKVASQLVLAMPQSRPKRTTTAAASGAT
jgi:hypothetical protein